MQLQFPQYSAAQNERLEDLLRQAEASPYQMAICDQLGRIYQAPSGKMKRVTERTPSRFRFEVRSRAHCEVYKFTPVYRNRKWRHACEAERAAQAKACTCTPHQLYQVGCECGAEEREAAQ